MNLVTVHRRRHKKNYKEWVRLVEVRTAALKLGIKEERLKEISATLNPEKDFARKYRKAIQREIENFIPEETEPVIPVRRDPELYKQVRPEDEDSEPIQLELFTPDPL